MAQPSFLSFGSTPTRTDTKWFRWTRILGRVQNNLASPNAANNPRRNDSLRDIKLKINRALTE